MPISDEDTEALMKSVLGMCAIMRTHPDLSSTQQLDLGFIHGELIRLLERRREPPEGSLTILVLDDL